MQPSTSGRVCVAYHYPCPDGVFAALAAALHLRDSSAALRFACNRVFAPCTVEDLRLEADETLYLLDYAGPPGFAQEAAQHAGRVVVLDHHKTAMEAFERDTSSLPPNLHVELDMARSGATIALDHFRPQVSEAQRRLFALIEDADLWRWALPGSRAFHAGFGALSLELDANRNPRIWEQLLALDPDAVIAQGEAVEAENGRLIAEAVAGAFVVSLGGEAGSAQGWGRCLAVRAAPGSQLGRLRSHLGNALAAESAQRGLRAIGLVAYTEPQMADPSQIKCSLRSKGAEDTTVISQALGGGGHLNASSFITALEQFERWRV